MHTHIIPQKYLKGFANSDGKIWTYRKGFLQPFYAPVKSIAAPKNFYSPAAETFLNVHIERPAQKAIEKIKERQILTLDDKKMLSRYLVNMMIRVPHAKTWIRREMPSVIGQIFDERNLMNLVGGRYLSVREKVDFALLRLKWEVEEESETVEAFWESQLSQDYSQTRAALIAMTWQFLTYDAPAFVTSDNPFFFFTSLGLANQLAEATFPVSRHIALWATWLKDEVPSYSAVSKKIVNEINHRTVSGRTHEIYSSVGSQWVANLDKERIYVPRRIVSKAGLNHSLELF